MSQIKKTYKNKNEPVTGTWQNCESFSFVFSSKGYNMEGET